MKEYIFDIDPQPAPRLVYSDKWSKRTEATKYYVYKEALQILALKNKFVPHNKMTLLFVMPIPPSWSKKKKEEMELQPHMQRPDWDNLAKAFQDALLKEDSHIWDVHVQKIWGTKGKIIARVYED